MKNTAEAKLCVGAENSISALRAPFTDRTSYVTANWFEPPGSMSAMS